MNEETGEIAVREGQSLDREVAAKMHILAIPVDGNDPIEIKIEILDENDNAPAFPVDSIRVGQKGDGKGELGNGRWKYRNMHG